MLYQRHDVGMGKLPATHSVDHGNPFRPSALRHFHIRANALWFGHGPNLSDRASLRARRRRPGCRRARNSGRGRLPRVLKTGSLERLAGPLTESSRRFSSYMEGQLSPRCLQVDGYRCRYARANGIRWANLCGVEISLLGALVHNQIRLKLFEVRRRPAAVWGLAAPVRRRPLCSRRFPRTWRRLKRFDRSSTGS